jgi:hypothetical protein
VLILRVWCAVVAGAVDREGAVASVGRWRHDRFAEVGTVDRPGRVDGGGVRLGADAVPEHRRGDGVHATDRHAMRGPGAGAAPQDEPCGLPTGRRAPFLHRERRRALSAIREPLGGHCPRDHQRLAAKLLPLRLPHSLTASFCLVALGVRLLLASIHT